MIRRIALVLAVALALAGASVWPDVPMGAVPAVASIPDEPAPDVEDTPWCDVNAVCFWDGINFTGAKFTLFWSQVRTWCTRLPSYINNKAASMTNMNNFTVYVRDGSTCGGSYYPAFAHEWIPNMGPYNDRASAVSVTSSL